MSASSDPAPTHPEEMRFGVEAKIGSSVSITATTRITPAGLIAAAVLIASILIPVVWLAQTGTRRELARR